MDPRGKRLRLMGWLLLLVGLVLVARLFYLQIIRHDHFQALADESQQAKFVIPAGRGEIYVYDGDKVVPLVLNQTSYRVYADPRFIKDAAAVANKLKDITGGDGERYINELQRKKAYVVLEPKVDSAKADAIRAAQLDGVGLTEIPIRAYAEGSLAGPVLGFVNNEGKGQYGLEQTLNSILSGKDGFLSGAVDVRGVPIATAQNVQTPASDGDDIVLTLDRNVQARAEAALATRVAETTATNGSVIVMDSQTGEIKAMASYPSYNPADFSAVTDISVFVNQAVNLAYEPGSIIKVFTMALGLDKGAVTPDTTYQDTSSREIDDYTIKNSAIRPVADRSMREVIKFSLNTGAIFVLEQLGGGQINDQAKTALYDFFTAKLLLNQPTKIEQTGEVAGQVDAPKGVSDVRYANMTFGQGLKLTMIRMIGGFNAIFNDGTYVEPQLIKAKIHNGVVSTNGSKQVATGIIKPETSAQLNDMIKSIVDESSARSARKDGYFVAGKTGTAQKYDPRTGLYSTDEVLSSFVGFVGNNTPRYTVMVRIDNPHYNHQRASPATLVFSDMTNWLINYYALAPATPSR